MRVLNPRPPEAAPTWVKNPLDLKLIYDYSQRCDCHQK